jgi:hypothetical protein
MFTQILAHTSMSYEEILERTIPQISAILEHLPKHLAIKSGLPISTEVDTKPQTPTLQDLTAFCNLF